MKEPEHLWFLLAIRPGDMTLNVLAVGESGKYPELLTEHEPRALAFLKNKIPGDEDVMGYKFHACRFTIHDDKDTRFKNDTERLIKEFGRF
ncbi:MAG TPA: hypothetical protein VN665_03160, partial [Candidatus Paceibacterota bacterium]|nr:hypothetical protein [Candidatus Paceibacterota bacterium]